MVKRQGGRQARNRGRQEHRGRNTKHRAGEVYKYMGKAVGKSSEQVRQTKHTHTHTQKEMMVDVKLVVKRTSCKSNE